MTWNKARQRQQQGVRKRRVYEPVGEAKNNEPPLERVVLKRGGPDAPCRGCGYLLCSCAPESVASDLKHEAEQYPGWKESFIGCWIHESGAWALKALNGPGFSWSTDGKPVIEKNDWPMLLEIAMALALGYKLIQNYGGWCLRLPAAIALETCVAEVRWFKTDQEAALAAIEYDWRVRQKAKTLPTLIGRR